MEEILKFISGILPLIQKEFDNIDPDKIGPETSKYIYKNIEDLCQKK